MSQTKPIISVPKLNPIRLYNIATEKAFYDSIPSHFVKKQFDQIYQKSDYLTFQLRTEWYDWGDILTTITAGLYDINEIKKYDIPLNVLFSGLNGWAIWECRHQLLNVIEGKYHLKIHVLNQFDDPPTYPTLSEYNLYSEPIYIKATHENSVLIEYSHDSNEYDMMFVHPNTRIKFNYFMRVYGGFEPTDYVPASKDVVYRDQTYDLTLLHSIPYNSEKFILGNSLGVPNYITDIFNRITSCWALFIDGKAYIKNDSSKLERKGGSGFPLAAWKIEIEEPEVTESIEYNFITPIYAGTAIHTHLDIATINKGDVVNGHTLVKGEYIVLLGQTDKTEHGIYVVGENEGETIRLAAYPTDVSCDGVVVYLTAPDDQGNYILTLYYDYTNNILMSAYSQSYVSSDKGVVGFSTETYDVTFNSLLSSVPTKINIQIWDANGQPVVGGYVVSSVSISGMTISVPGNSEALKAVYNVEI